MAGIFINYRREDSKAIADRLFDHLYRRFDKQVFFDVQMDPGVDWVDKLNEMITKCDVLLVLIGPHWIDIRDASGQRRLDDPNDRVRMEVAQALSRNIRVIIPVLVGGAALPRPTDLPEDLSSLTRRQSFEILDSRFREDTTRLIDSIQRTLDNLEAERCDATQPAQLMAESQRARPVVQPLSSEATAPAREVSAQPLNTGSAVPLRTAQTDYERYVRSLPKAKQWFLLYSPLKRPSWIPRILFYFLVLDFIGSMLSLVGEGNVTLPWLVLILLLAYSFRFLAVAIDKPRMRTGVS